MTDQEKKIRDLLEMAEDNQQAVQDAIACFTAEREAFTKERLALAKVSANSAQMQDTFRHFTSQAIPALETAVQDAVNTSVLGVSSISTSNAIGSAAKPILERFSSIAEMADVLQGKVNAATQRFAWQWTTMLLLGLASTVLVAYVSLHEIKNDRAALAQEKAAFAAEVAQMQSTVLALERRGGRIRMDRCGPENRLCIEVSTDQGRGRETLKGAWYDINKQTSYVIPRGY
jgi:hypothetical protein